MSYPIIIVTVLVVVISLSTVIYMRRSPIAPTTISHPQVSTDFSVGTKPASEPLHTVLQDWQENDLVVRVIGETQSCGGVSWIPSYTITGKEIKVIARGKGVAMNCPMIPVAFSFKIKGLAKDVYTIVPDISIIWDGLK